MCMKDSGCQIRRQQGEGAIPHGDRVLGESGRRLMLSMLGRCSSCERNLLSLSSGTWECSSLGHCSQQQTDLGVLLALWVIDKRSTSVAAAAVL